MANLLQQGLRLALCVAGYNLAACQEHDHPSVGTTPPVVRPAVVPPAPLSVAKQLGKSNFWVSLPATYALKTTEEPDFLVYYFAPADITVRTSFTGGLYFGGFPQGIDSAASCQQRRVPATVLGRPVTFAVQRCATGYSLNAVFDSGQPWNPKIHAFGEAKSAVELRQLLAIFATLRHRAASTGPESAAAPTH